MPTKFFRNLYYGVSPTLMFTTFAWSFNFYAYQQALKLLNKFGKSNISEHNKITNVMIAGFLSGFAWSTCVTPIELIKCYSQSYHLKSIDSMKDIINKYGKINGFKLLYRGYISCILRDTPSCTIYFTILELSRKYLPNYNNSKLMQFIGGAAAPLAAWFFTIPIDCIKSNIQTKFALYAKNAINDEINYKNIPSSKFLLNLKIVWRENERNIFKMWYGFRYMAIRTCVCGGINVIYQEFMLTHLLRRE